MTKSGSDDARRILADCKSYRLTTEMIVALSAIFKRHYGASIDTGRKVRRESSAAGQVVPGPVTPDMMVQGRGLSIVVEIKAGFPSGPHARQKIFEQLKKYDSRLVGWMERDVDRHDIMVVTRIQSAVEMSDYIESKASAAGGAFSNPLCVAELALLGGDEESFFVRAVSGRLTNARLRSSMRRGIEIGTASALLSFSGIWFYDSEPDLPYTMSVLWDKIFSEASGRVSTAGQKTVLLRMTVDEIMEGFQALAPSAPSRPRRKWIAKAMDGLVKIRMAERAVDGTYIVRYTVESENMLEVFAGKWAAAHNDGDVPGHA